MSTPGWFVYERVGPGVERIAARFPDGPLGYRSAMRRARSLGQPSEVTVDGYPPSVPVKVLNPPEAKP